MDEVPDEWIVRAADRELGPQDFDAISFEDSERFEGDSDGDSYAGSLSESLNWDWRDAVIPDSHSHNGYPDRRNLSSRISIASDCTLQPSPIPKNSATLKGPLSLSELASQCCAKHLAFYQLEAVYRFMNLLKRNKLYPYAHVEEVNLPVSDTFPDRLFLKIIKYCFPPNLDATRLYSVLTSGKPEYFNQGKALYESGQVNEVVQIGYLISATVTDELYLPSTKATYPHAFRVSIKVDRCTIIQCKCSCEDQSEYCPHIVALIMFRLYEPQNVRYRVTIWDSINELSEEKVKMFAQYLINELPKHYIIIAQRLLDTLNDPFSEINNSRGAPDPTDGGHEPVASMSYNDKLLHEMLRRQLHCFCLKQNQAHGFDELNAPKNSVSQEFQRHLQPLANLDPPAMHNYVLMMKNMLVRQDPNAVALIRTVTEECMANRLVLLNWYCAKLIQSGKWQMLSDDNQVRQLNIGQLCDEVVGLWKRVALNPSVDAEYREQLFVHLQRYHRLAAERIFKIIKSTTTEDSMVGHIISNIVTLKGETLSPANARFTVEFFPGFLPAMRMCIANQNMEFKEIPLGRNNQMKKWPDYTIDLLPEQLPQSPKKRSKRKHHRRGNRRNSRRNSRDHTRNNSRNRDQDAQRYARVSARRNRREIESSESGQESEQEEIDLFPEEDTAAVIATSYAQLDPFEMKFVKCEAVAAHGYWKKASRLALDLIDSLMRHLEDYPSLDQPCTSDTSIEPFEILHNYTAKRLDILEKSILITHILSKEKDRNAQSKLFNFIIDVLLQSKRPMSSKFAQVKEHYQEMELLKMLQTIEIQKPEVERMRLAAEEIREILENEGIPPIGLAKFIFEELSYSPTVVKFDHINNPQYRKGPALNGRIPEDDDLALAVAVNAIGTKVLYSDTDFPMLCESVRNLKAQLTLTLLVSFKDCKEKLGIVLDRLLDPRIHQLYKKYFTNAVYFLKESCETKKYFPGQRPFYRYECKKQTSRDEEPLDENQNARTDEELRKIMSTKSLTAVKQQQEQSRRTNYVHTKGKRFKTRTIASATDAYPNFMYDLGKRVLSVAGGNPTTLFAAVHHNTVTHRNLHICSLLISLYGLGVSNKAKKNTWMTRSYSAEVSWITQQIPEIGPHAYDIVREIYWEFHFTASEMAALAEKTIQTQHPQAQLQAALLSLAILPYCQNLPSTEIKYSINRCRDMGPEYLEKACDAIYKCADTHGDISADIMFIVARHYEELYKEMDANKNVRKTSGHVNVPQLQHMSSYPGAPTVYIQNQYQNQYQQFVQGGQQMNHQYNQGGFRHDFQRMNLQPQDQAGPSGLTSLHQSHSAPQLSHSSGATASTRLFVPRLVRAYKAGVKAMGSVLKSNTDITKAHYSRAFQFQNDVEWLCDLVINNLSLEQIVEFFDYACSSMSCPYTLFYITQHCYNLNLKLFLQGLTLPPGPQKTDSKNTTMQQQNTPPPPIPPRNPFQHPQGIQSLIQVPPPPPRISLLRACMTIANYPEGSNGYINMGPTSLPPGNFHTVTMDLIEKCADILSRAINSRLSFSSFSDLDRAEVEKLLSCFVHLMHMVPRNQHFNEAMEHLCWNVRRAKQYRYLSRNPSNVTDPQFKQFLVNPNALFNIQNQAMYNPYQNF